MSDESAVRRGIFKVKSAVACKMRTCVSRTEGATTSRGRLGWQIWRRKVVMRFGRGVCVDRNWWSGS